MLRLLCFLAVLSVSEALDIDEALLNKIEISISRHDEEIKQLVAENQQLRELNNALTANFETETKQLRELSKAQSVEFKTLKETQNDQIREFTVQVTEQALVISAQGQALETLQKILVSGTTSDQDEMADEGNRDSVMRSGSDSVFVREDLAVQNEALTTSKRSSIGQRTKRMLIDAEETETDPGYVAFTAKLGAHATGLGNQQAIIFERMQTNVGDAYSANTGVFSAPLAGVYFFTATIMSHYGDYLETEIVVNGNHVVYMYSSDTKHEQGTNSAVLTLNQNDEVWVRHNGQEGDRVHGGDWSTFSGFLLHITS